MAELHSRTLYLLRKIDVDLELAPPLSQNHSIFKAEPATYRDGLFAVGQKNDKGEMLWWLMQQEGFKKAKRVVFIDDKKRYVESLENEFQKHSFPLKSYRYGAADERVKAFDSRLAEIQTSHFLKFGQILPDEVALVMRKSSLKSN